MRIRTQRIILSKVDFFRKKFIFFVFAVSRKYFFSDFARFLSTAVICIDDSYKDVVMKLENRRDVMGRIDTDHSMVVAKIKTEKPEEGGGKRRQVKIKQGGNKKEKEGTLTG